MRQTISQNEETRKSLEVMLQNQMGEIKSHAIAIRNLEIQVRQMASERTISPQGALPSNTEAPRGNGKEQCQAVTLRSGKVLPTEMQDQRTQGNLQPHITTQLTLITPTIEPQPPS